MPLHLAAHRRPDFGRNQPIRQGQADYQQRNLNSVFSGFHDPEHPFKKSGPLTEKAPEAKVRASFALTCILILQGACQPIKLLFLKGIDKKNTPAAYKYLYAAGVFFLSIPFKNSNLIGWQA
ncbi:hypothetical protein, partial [Trichloromonas sp.]|uniref:hypothetical protein n=1 Tax=Trichloromonas sp. TaxID=3069249 RepID=UPI003D81A93B